MPQAQLNNEDDTDALLDALENEESTPSYAAERIAQLKAELSSQSNPHPTSSAAGTVTTLINNSPLPTLPNDQATLDFTTQISHCIIHFFHPDFSRCGTMDKHLSRLSDAHGSGTGVRFARVDVRDVPFIVEKLKIRVLPCVIGFIDGEIRERVLGFEGLGAGGMDALGDDFETGVLERRFVQSGVLSSTKIGQREEDDDSEEGKESRKPGFRKTIRSGKKKADDDDSDWD